MFAVSGVSAEWVDESFTSLRVSLPGGSTYRITYTSVNESNATEPKTVTTNSISHVAKDFRPDWFYSVKVEAVSLDSDEVVNGSIGIGEQFHVMLFEILLFMCNCDCMFYSQAIARSFSFDPQELGLLLLLLLLLLLCLYY